MGCGVVIDGIALGLFNAGSTGCQNSYESRMLEFGDDDR